MLPSPNNRPSAPLAPETELPASLRMPDGAGEPAPEHRGHRERLRTRFLAEPEALPDYELLEMLLFAARTRGDTKPLAKRLLKEFGSLGAVLAAEPARLARVKGAEGEAVLAALRVAREAAVRLARAPVMRRQVIQNWQALLDYCQVAMRDSPVEQFRIMFLDRRNALIADEVQQRGTVDHTPAYPREVVKRALELGASALILVHNHPSGDPTPSKADIDLTRRIQDATRSIGIALHDHLVIGSGSHASFKSLGLL